MRPLASTCLAVLALTTGAAGQTLPPDFVVEQVGGGWVTPVGLCFAEQDLVFVCEPLDS